MQRGLVTGPSLRLGGFQSSGLQRTWGRAGRGRCLLWAPNGTHLPVSSDGVQRFVKVPLPPAIETVDELSVMVTVGDYRPQTFRAGLEKHHNPTSFRVSSLAQVPPLRALHASVLALNAKSPGARTLHPSCRHKPDVPNLFISPLVHPAYLLLFVRLPGLYTGIIIINIIKCQQASL